MASKNKPCRPPGSIKRARIKRSGLNKDINVNLLVISMLKLAMEEKLWMARQSKQSILKEINPEYSLEGLILKLRLQYFGHLT